MALDQNEAVLTVLGPGKEPVHVHQRGLPGGYRFHCTTGPVGEIWGFTDTQPQGWNGVCSVRAATLAAHGWHGTVQQVFARLESLGCHPTDHRVAGVDCALDFLMPPAFELGLEQFVAHSRSNVKSYWGKRDEASETATRPTAICRGRRLESVTFGKMPVRQICVYDKRREAVEQVKPLWFRLCGLDPAGAANVWRVELRAGKKELRRWPIRTLAHVEEDFCTDGSPPLAIHPDLTSQLPEDQSVNVYLDVGSFFSDMIAPYLKGLDINEIPDDLADRAIELIGSRLANYSTFGFEDVPIQNEARITDVGNTEIKDREIQSLDDDEFLVTFNCECDANIEGFMEKSEYYSGDHDVHVWDSDWNDWVIAVSTNARLPVRVIFTYSKSEGGITDSDVDLPT
jgi:hypothetical protein